MTYRPIHEKDNLYFVTGTIIRWTPIFKKSEYRDIIIDSLKWLSRCKRMKLFAFVIMSNHLHWISYPVPPYTINANIRSFASFTAHQILREARIHIESNYLQVFSKYAEHGKSHKIWKNFQAKNIYSQGFLLQKMEYIHNNPLGKYSLRARADYPFSSARYYDEGKDAIIKVEDIFDYIENL